MPIIIFLNGPTLASFSFIFGIFKQTIQFLQQIIVKKCPSSIWRRDSNPQPLKYELSPITTRPGRPPNPLYFLIRVLVSQTVGKVYVCKQDGKCDVSKKNRKKCQKCRYEACLRVGMDPALVLTEDQKKARFRKMLEKKNEPKIPGMPG